jgi:uncharacterized protein involved in type VI secretion and phage assembly
MDTKFGRDNFKYHGIHRAVVLDNDDPGKFGRIKVNVFGLYTGIDAEDLPWAAPMFPIGSGSGVGYGSFSVPEVGTYVFVMFEGLDIYQPVYVGSAPDAVHGLPTDRIASYPSTKVLRTKNGTVLKINDANGSVTILSSTGSSVVIDGSGNISVSGGDITISGGAVVISGSTVNINP